MEMDRYEFLPDLIVHFKKHVYEKVLVELKKLLINLLKSSIL